MSITVIDNNIADDYISYEVAKLLTDNGCKVISDRTWIQRSDGRITEEPYAKLEHILDFKILCYSYTQRVAINWIEKNYSVYIIPTIKFDNGIKFGYNINTRNEILKSNDYDSYFEIQPEAINQAIKYTLKNLSGWGILEFKFGKRKFNISVPIELAGVCQESPTSEQLLKIFTNLIEKGGYNDSAKLVRDAVKYVYDPVTKLNIDDISVLKYYKDGNELSGFENVHRNLCDNDYLDSDLELTDKARKFIREYKFWDDVKYSHE